MEDPISFDTYVRVQPGEVARAAQALRELRPELTELEAHRLANRSATLGHWILLGSQLPWGQATSILETVPAFFPEVQLLQAGREPSDSLSYCESHNLHVAGVLGCPVCSGFFVA